MASIRRQCALGRKCGPLVCLVVVLMLCWPSRGAFSSSLYGGVSLVPQVSFFGPLQTLGLWQLPEEGPPRKLLVIFKARNVSAYDFWDHSRECLQCAGLPEKRKLVADALSRRYGVLMPESIAYDGDWEAWPEDSPDMLNVLTVMSEWKKQIGCESLPMVAIGISAGGFAVSTLALRPGLFESTVNMIAFGTEEAWKAATPEYPPTIFVHMPRDSWTARKIANARSILDSRGVITSESRWYPHALTPEWYSESIAEVSPALSKAIFDRIRGEGWLNEDNFLINEDYYDIWDITFAQWNLFPSQLEGAEQQLLVTSTFDETCVAAAEHTTIARNDDITFGWLDGDHNLQKELHSVQ